MSIPTLSTPSSLSLARSPLFVTAKNNALANDSLDSMTLNIKVWSGALGDEPSTFNYQLSKSYSINEVINFEIADLIRSEFSHSFATYDATSIEQSISGEVLYVEVSGDWTYSDNGTAPTTAVWATGDKFFVADGWRKYTQNTEHTISPMAVSRKRFVSEMGYETLPIYWFSSTTAKYFSLEWANGDYEDVDIQATSSISPSSGSTTAKLLYLPAGVSNLNAYTGFSSYMRPVNRSGQTNYTLSIKNASGTKLWEQAYEITCEPKYTPYQIAFVNRYGASDYITMFKRSAEQGNFTNEQYNRSIYVDGFTTPNLQEAKYQDFNINSRNAWTLNTGWVEEAYADVIEDILMSERVAILMDGTWVAASPQRGSVNYQKEVNEKNINYTMTFDIAFDQRNLLR